MEYEILIKDFPKWFTKYSDKIFCIGEHPTDVIITYKECSFKEYKKSIYSEYPTIIVSEKLLTEVNDVKEIPYFFFPSVEYSDIDECYLNPTDEYTVKYITHIESVDSIIERSETLKNINLNNFESKNYQTYLMFDSRGFCKIGRSKYPIIRESTLQSENPFVELFAVLDKDIEKYLHNEFKNKRIRGEWFKLSIEEIKYIMDTNGFSYVHRDKTEHKKIRDLFYKKNT